VDRNAFSGDWSGTSAQPRTELAQWLKENFQIEMDEGRIFAGTFLFVEGINREKAQATYHHFKRSLDREFYGKAAQRHAKGIKHVAVLEGGPDTSKNFHYHSIFVKPIDRMFSNDEFITVIKQQWTQMLKSMRYKAIASEVVPVTDLDGWVGYLTKSATKSKDSGLCFMDTLDPESLKL
jgi:hypothetical protein